MPSTSMVDEEDVRRALSQERWFRAKTPTWNNAKTHKVAIVMSKSWIKRLKRNSGQNPVTAERLELAARLKGCRPRRRCLSGCCPKCGRAFQRWVVDIVTGGPWGDVMTEPLAISLVPPAAYAWLGHLNDFDHEGAMDWIKALLVDSGVVRKAFLGWDVSFNDLSERRLRSRWQMQAYVIAEVTNRRKLFDYLTEALPASNAVTRPVRTRSYDGSTYGASYALKYEFNRRRSYKAKNGRWTTKKRRLQAGEHIELMKALANIGLSGRIRLIGLHARRASPV